MGSIKVTFEYEVLRGRAAVQAISDILAEYRIRRDAERAQAERDLALLDGWLAEHDAAQQRFQLEEWE